MSNGIEGALDRIQSKAGVVTVCLTWHRDRDEPFCCDVEWYDAGDDDVEDELEEGSFWGATRLEAVSRAARWLGVSL